jgi:hypothetical protein
VVGDPVLRCRALVLHAAVALQRGDLHGGVALTAEAEPYAAGADDDAARAEQAAVKGQLNFFAGAYAESLLQAERAIGLADPVGDLGLRVFTRRYACVEKRFGSLEVIDNDENGHSAGGGPEVLGQVRDRASRLDHEPDATIQRHARYLAISRFAAEQLLPPGVMLASRSFRESGWPR